MDIFGRKRIAELEKANANLNWRLEQWEKGSRAQMLRYDKIMTELRTYQRAVGRIIGKIDPAYTNDPFDPAVRARSDAIGDQVIARLRGEVVASQKQIGDE